MKAPECPDCGKSHLNEPAQVDAWLVSRGAGKSARGLIEVDLGRHCRGPAYFTVGHAQKLVDEIQQAIAFVRAP